MLESIDPTIITAERCRRSLAYFVKEFWSEVEIANPYIHNWHIDVISDHLEHIQEIRNLLINMPPRFGKSLIVDCLFPAWRWINNPETQFVFASYNMDLSEDSGRKCRNLLLSDKYKSMFPHIQFLDNVCGKSEVLLSQGGKRLAKSVESGVTGWGGSILVIDDPHRANEFDGTRENTIAWFWNAWCSRLNNPSKDCKIVITQRTHINDLSGDIIKKNEGDWTILSLPFEYRSTTTTFIGYPPLGHVDPRSTPGEPLWPERFPPESIKSLKQDRATWETQWNQNPLVSSECLFKPEYFQSFTEDNDTYFLDGEEVDKVNTFRLMACDLAATKKKDSDYSAIVTADITLDGHIIITHVHRDKIAAPRLVPTVAALFEQHRPNYVLVEYSNFDALIVEELKIAGLPIRGIKASIDKESKSIPLQIKFEDKRVWFPKNKPWVEPLQVELISFTGARGRKDDQVDCLSMLAAEANKRTRFKPKPKVEVERDEAKEYQEALLYGLD